MDYLTTIICSSDFPAKYIKIHLYSVSLGDYLYIRYNKSYAETYTSVKLYFRRTAEMECGTGSI